MRTFLPSVFLAAVLVTAARAGDIVLENARFRLVVGEDAVPRSLVVKATGEECLRLPAREALFAAVQERPYNNELKLIRPNVRTTYPAVRLRREGDSLVAGFEHGMYEARISVSNAADYLSFTLDDFIIDRATSYDYLKMDIPPVAAFRVLQLPVANRTNFGSWLNAAWDERAAIGVLAASPEPDVSADALDGARLLAAELVSGRRLRGGTAALVVADGKEGFLDAVDAFERDYGLPRGVRSRRDPIVSEPIFHVNANCGPADAPAVIEWAKRGGFKLVTFGYHNLFCWTNSWGLCGEYRWREEFPNGEADVRMMLDRFHAAGIKCGFHTLVTHIGFLSRYVTPVADPRLGKKRRYTLATPIPAESEPGEITVFETTADAPLYEPCRILQFGGELFTYTNYTSSRPYRFLGVRRRALGTLAAAHVRGEVGGVLDVSEFGTPASCYPDVDTDLVEELARPLADAYNCGFDYVYLDGAEGVNPPCGYHVADAQYRYWKMLSPEPLFGESAAKTHFGWHMLAGANAFDSFKPEVFKEMLRRHPLVGAPLIAQDMTRIDFGWWNFFLPSADGVANPTIGTQPDMWEYGAALAAAWDGAMSVNVSIPALEMHPRGRAIMEAMRRWNDFRRAGGITPSVREKLRTGTVECHLHRCADGTLELVTIKMLPPISAHPKLRGFTFESNGRRFVRLWHVSGSERLTADFGFGPRTLDISDPIDIELSPTANLPF